MSDKDHLIEQLHRIGAVRFGRFELASGRISPIYLDLRLLVSHPAVLKAAAAAYARLLAPLPFDTLAAIPYAGLPIGTAISLEMERPLIFPRKAVKSYGTGRQIEGAWEPGQHAVMIEDLVTSGGSVLEGVALLRENGLIVTDAVVLIDRQQGGREALAAANCQLHAVLTLSELLETLRGVGTLSADTVHDIRHQLNLP
jgi:uridine monophosphate synthetase